MTSRKISKVLVHDEAERPSTDLENILDSQADNQSLVDTINHKIYSLIERLAYSSKESHTTEDKPEQTGLLEILAERLTDEHSKLVSILEGVERLESLL